METQKLINNIDSCISWIKAHKEQDYEQRYLELVEQRRKIKQIAEAEKNNPGIAAFGKSQVGKSYLVGCMLKGNNKAFMVKAGDKTYNFSDEINPPSDFGGGVESTGVVSRFSSFNRKSLVYNSEYPVLVKTFSLTDIIVILSDSYFNDIDYNSSLMDNEIIQKGDEIKNRFSNTDAVSNPLICADDVLYMKEYFSKHLNNAKRFVELDFFDKVAAVIENVSEDNYLSIFSFIWNSDGKGIGFNQLYEKIYGILREYDFAEYLYLPIEAVLHGGDPDKTILGVKCLEKLFSGDCGKTDVYIRKNEEYIKVASDTPKSAVSAVCREAIFRIENDFLSFSQPYDTSEMSEVIAKEFKDEEGKDRLVGMSMLKENDLLDFPGARARLTLNMAVVNISGKNVENLMKCFLRGKVAYLFNQYNDKSIINILLFCHNNKDSDVSNLPRLLEDWVNNYVGATSEERMKKLETTKISPLFFISTMFNIDLDIKNDENVTESNRNGKWIKRFETVTNSQTVMGRTLVDWLNNWVKKSGDNDGKFRNSYVLRDFKYSCPDYGNIYKGYAETGKEQTRIISDKHYTWLHDTFRDNQFCKQFFKNPQLSFEVAATKNNDGSLYILEKLDIAAKNIGEARNKDFDNVSHSVAKNVYNIMYQYFVNDDEAQILLDNIQKAAKIKRVLDPLCSREPEFFGHLLSKMQLSETDSFNHVHDLALRLGEIVHQAEGVATVCAQTLVACDHFKGCNNCDEKWQRLIDYYKFADKKESEEWLESVGINPDELFNAKIPAHTNSAVITREMLKFWDQQLKKNELSTGNNYSELGFLKPCLANSAKYINISGIIENKIAGLVDGLTAGFPEELVADIISSEINNFVMDFGYSHYTDEQKDNVREINETQHLHCFDKMEVKREEYDGGDDLHTASLFDDILSDGNLHSKSFNFFYSAWKEYMTIAFVANLKVPDYDKQANSRLKSILDQIRNV